MSSIQTIPLCSSIETTFATAYRKCDILPGNTVTVFITQPGVTFEIDTFVSKLQEYINTGKIIPIFGISNNEPTGGELKESSSAGYGVKQLMRGEAVTDKFTVSVGGVCLFSEITRMFKRYPSGRVFRVDQGGNVWGTVTSDGTKTYFQGYDFGTSGVERAETSGEVPQLKITFKYSMQYFNQLEQESGVAIPSTPTGIDSVILQKLANSNYMVVESCSHTNMSELFDKVNFFIKDTGTAPTSVSLIDGVNGKEIKILPNTAGDKYKIAAISVLVLNGLSGFVGDSSAKFV